VTVAAALMLTVGLAATGAFSGCGQTERKSGRPSQAVSASANGAVAYVTAKAFARTVHPRVADTWGEIKAREFVFTTFQRFGYFPLTQEFIFGSGRTRVHSANIVAVKQGESARRLIVGAHYDSVAVGDGYADNASGLALLLETAARIKAQPTPYTIVFIAFGAEERGALGSGYYARTMSETDRRATLGMIDLDAVAGGDKLYATSGLGSAKWLRDDALAAAQDLGLPVGTSPAHGVVPAGVATMPSDDSPFERAGVPTVAFTATNWDLGRRNGAVNTAKDGRLWHTAKDTVDYIEKAYPGRMREQLADLSLLLETLLTSKLEKRP
jgi:alkaline phosphatase isozyme conversion protein